MSREPQVGDTYKVICKFATLGTNADGLEPYYLGDTLKLVGTTDVNPFGHKLVGRVQALPASQSPSHKAVSGRQQAKSPPRRGLHRAQGMRTV